MTSLRKQDDMIHVGAIVGVHGLLGHVKIKPFVNEIDLIVKGTTLMDESGNAYTLHKSKIIGQKKLAFKFIEVTDRTAAEKLIGTDLYLDLTTFDAEQFEQSIVGQTVLSSSGKVIGVIENIFDNGAHEVLEVKTPEGIEVLIPYTDTHTMTNDKGVSLTLDGEACLEV